jgi:glycosyltransferase involved in cell wall biosynthesis
MNLRGADSLRILNLQHGICGRTYKKYVALKENFQDIEFDLVVRQRTSAIYDKLGYAYSDPVPLFKPLFSGHDLFLRYFDDFNRTLGRKLKKLVMGRSSDIIHSHGPADDLGCIAKKYTDYPVVHEVFDSSSLYDVSLYGDWIKGGAIEKLGMTERLRKRILRKDLEWEKFIHENADGIVYTSEYMLNYVKDRYDIRANSIVIPNTILKKDMPIHSKSKMSEKDGEIHTVYVGALSKDSGHRNILPILNKITKQKIHVHIYGLLSPSVKPTLDKKEKEDEYLHVHEALHYTKLYPELTRYDMGLVILAPSNERLLHTAVPNKIYEYLASDLPVIVSPYDSLVDFVKKRNCGFVLDDVNDIHSKIKEKFNIGSKEEYTMDYHIPKLVKMYERLLNC